MRKILYAMIIMSIFVSPLNAKKNLGYYLVGESFEGLTLYSWLLPMGIGLEDNTALGIGLLTPMVWTGLSYANSLTTQNITGGMVLSSVYGGWNGLLEGIFIGDSTNWSSIALLMSTVENFGNYHLFNALNLNTASAQRWSNFSWLGLFDFGIVDEFKSDDIFYGVIPLVASYGSIPLFMNDDRATWGDAFFEAVSSATMLGSVWSMSIGIDESALDQHRTYRIISGIGATTLGYGIGYYLGRNRDISTPAAIFTLLVPTIVNMTVTGSVILLSGSEDAGFILSGILIPVGVYGSYFLFSKEQQSAVNTDKTGKINLMLNPYAGVMALLKNRPNERINSIPIGMLTYSF